MRRGGGGPVIDHPRLAVGDGFLGVFFVFVRFILGAFQQREADLSADAPAVERPAGGPLEKPREHNQMPAYPLQGQHAGAVGFEVVQMGNDDQVYSRLAQEGADDIFFKLPLRWVLALSLRKDDGYAGHGRSEVLGVVSERLFVHLAFDGALGNFPDGVQVVDILRRGKQSGTVASDFKQPAALILIDIDRRRIGKQLFIKAG